MTPPWSVGAIGILHGFVTPYFIGVTEWGDNASPHTSLALPAATQTDDFLVVALIGSNAASCSDSRMTNVWTGSQGGRPAGVWVGRATTLSALTINVTNNATAFGQYTAGGVWAFRDQRDKKIYLDPTRVADSGSFAGGSGTLPALPRYGSGAIAVEFSTAGIGGAYGTSSWTGYTVAGGEADGGYVVIDVGYSQSKVIASQPAPQHNTAASWRGIVVGLK